MAENAWVCYLVFLMTLTQCSLTNNFGGVAILLLDFVLQEGLSRPE